MPNEIDLTIGILTKEHSVLGLRLREMPEDNLVILYLNEKAVKAWPKAHELKLETILHEADQFLEWDRAKRSGITFEKEGG